MPEDAPKGSPENPMTRDEAVELMGEEEVQHIEETAVPLPEEPTETPVTE